ncbi:RNA-binding (RRM/RBD/RNP motifs) family protein isoform X1 [Wolffia australiana]
MFVAAQAIVSTSSSSSAFASQTVASARFTKAFGAKEFPPASRIFIRNLSYATNEARLKNSFSDFGKIAEVQIPIDEATKKPKGFAFVQYYSQEEAVVALEQMDGKDGFFCPGYEKGFLLGLRCRMRYSRWKKDRMIFSSRDQKTIPSAEHQSVSILDAMLNKDARGPSVPDGVVNRREGFGRDSFRRTRKGTWDGTKSIPKHPASPSWRIIQSSTRPGGLGILAH